MDSTKYIDKIALEILDKFRKLHLDNKFPFREFDPEVAHASLSFCETYGNKLKEVYQDLFVGLGLFGGRSNGLSTHKSDIETIVFFEGINLQDRNHLFNGLNRLHGSYSILQGIPYDGGVEFVHPPYGVFTRFFDSAVVYGSEERIIELSIETLDLCIDEYAKIWLDVAKARHQTLASYKPDRMIERIESEANKEGREIDVNKRHQLSHLVEENLTETRKLKLEKFGLEKTPSLHRKKLVELLNNYHN